MSGAREKRAVGRAALASRRFRRFQDGLFVALLLALAGLGGALAERHGMRLDWTAGAAHTLSATSREVLGRVEGPVEVTAFVRPGSAAAAHVAALLERYRRAYPGLVVIEVNPDLDPARVRELGITAEGELVLVHGGRQQRVSEPSEQGVTNGLLALVRGSERRVLFLAGHGERRPRGEANHDLGRFGDELARGGFAVEPFSPAAQGPLPEAAALLVIAGPRVALLPGELEQVEAYLERGGNLLWLDEPELPPLEPLLARLGLRALPGVVVDATGQAYGIGDPSFAVVAAYPEHPLTRGFAEATLYPQARAFEPLPGSGWRAQPLLQTPARSWAEGGPVDGTVRHDPGEPRGPLTLGFALSRPRDGGGEQRVVVLGDGDFLANTYLGNAGNLGLGLRLLNWLVEDDDLVTIPPRQAPDRNLALSQPAFAAIGFGFLLGAPLLLLGAGLGTWWRRRRR